MVGSIEHNISERQAKVNHNLGICPLDVTKIDKRFIKY